jgi:hypothetical protein
MAPPRDAPAEPPPSTAVNSLAEFHGAAQQVGVRRRFGRGSVRFFASDRRRRVPSAARVRVAAGGVLSTQRNE